MNIDSLKSFTQQYWKTYCVHVTRQYIPILSRATRRLYITIIIHRQWNILVILLYFECHWSNQITVLLVNDKCHAATALFKSKRSTVARTTTTTSNLGHLDLETGQSSALARKREYFGTNQSSRIAWDWRIWGRDAQATKAPCAASGPPIVGAG